MPTIIESLQNAASRLDAAVQAVLGLRSELQALKDSASSSVTTIINTFINRPPVQDIFCDPIAGDDAKDGLTIANAKKTIEAIVSSMGVGAVRIVLLGDTVIQSRPICYGALTIQGAQRAATPRGWSDMQRVIAFLGSATNSPAEAVGTFCSGLFLSGSSFTTIFVNFRLPVQPANQTYPAHFWSGSGTNMSFRSGTLLVDGAGAGSLVGVSGSRSNVFSDLALGSGATGKLFQGIAAGGNPNSNWAYSSNVTAA